MNVIKVETCTSINKGPVITTTPLVIFLERVQESALRTYGQKGFDTKLFVDMSLRHGLSEIIEAFNKLSRTVNGSISVNDLDGFIGKYLGGADEDLVYIEPVDFVSVVTYFIEASPSSGDFELLFEMGGARFDMQSPTISQIKSPTEETTLDTEDAYLN
ncbi:hypothetical protein RND71_043017 [Anisodus tanguticus]|uniref:Uncharacterized protein n=1 Tax=Anisodus tanguticus TaxID=243964 RepID=A0AAE1UV85_9SOLA|nr:hypothetical protein RND71_043017 [Anisodus tanguticus]